jgi:hypothetical protein
MGDNEEGVSLYDFEEPLNLRLKGFDIGLKQIIFADSVPIPGNSNLIACLDYDGCFSILDHLRDCTNPLLRDNLDSLFTRSFNQLIRKFLLIAND